jgi:hypothetical protein
METSSFQHRDPAPPDRVLVFCKVGVASGHGGKSGRACFFLPSNERNFIPVLVRGNYYALAEAGWLDRKSRFLHVKDAWLPADAQSVAPPPDFL